MYQKTQNSIRWATIFGFVFIFALGVAWAKSYKTSKSIGEEGGWIPINVEFTQSASVFVPKGALSDYLDSEELDSVEIQVKMTEKKNKLDFTFGPFGLYFDPPLELILSGEYVNAEMTLLSENGELLEYTSYFDGKVMVFKIPHFSSYIYDHYDY